VHVLGQYIDAAVLRAIVPALFGVVVPDIVDRIIRRLGPEKRHAETDWKRPDVMRRDLGRLAEYLDGLPVSEPAVRQPFELGLAAMRACRWAEAIGHFRDAMTATKGTHLVALFNLTGMCQYTRGRPSEALRDFEESVRLAVEYQSERGRAQALNNIGLICHDNGELDRALEYLGESLAMASELDDQWAVAIQLGNTGNIWHDKGDLDKALQHHEQALAISRELRDQWGVATELGNIGSIYRDKGDLDKALQHYEQALAISHQIGYQLGVVTGLASIGSIYRDKGRIDKVLEYEEQALAIARKAGYSLGVATYVGDIGLALMEKSKHRQAVPKLAEALTILLASGVADGPRQALTGLGRCEDRLGRKRVEGLLKGAGLDDETIADLLERIDQVRMRRPGPRGDRPPQVQTAGQ